MTTAEVISGLYIIGGRVALSERDESVLDETRQVIGAAIAQLERLEPELCALPTATFNEVEPDPWGNP